MDEPELTPGRKVRGGSGRRVSATSPGAVRRAESGAPGLGRGRRLPAMSPLTQAASVGLGVSALSRAAPCVTFSVAPRQELGAARAAASWSPGSGRGVQGPKAPHCPLLPTAPRPSRCSVLGSPGSVATSRLPQGPRRCAPVPPLLPRGRGTWSPRSGPCPGSASPRAASSAGCVLLCLRPSHSRRRPLRLGPGPRRVPGSPGSLSSRRPRRAENSQLAARAPLRRLSPLLTRDPRPAAEAARPGCQPQADPTPALLVRLTHAGRPLAPGTQDSSRSRGSGTGGGGGKAAPSGSRADPARVFLLAPPHSYWRIRSKEDPLPDLRGPWGQVGRVLRAQRRVGGNQSCGGPGGPDPLLGGLHPLPKL